MNIRLILVGLLAVSFAGLAVLLARNWLQSNQQSAEAPVQQETAITEILAASQNLPAGKILTTEDLEWIPWPMELVSETHIERADNAMTNLVGQVVRHAMVDGEPVLTTKLVTVGSESFVTAMLTPGMVGLSLSVTRDSGLSGLVFPGDRVDVILTRQFTDATGRSARVSETVVRNARVIGVDTNTNSENQTPEVAKAVTIEVTPKIAERVATVRHLGDFTLTLRSLAQEGQPESFPVAVTDSRTFDADVTPLLPEVEIEEGKNIINVSRGNQLQAVEIDRSGQ